MKRILTVFLLFLSAKMAYSERQPLQRSRFIDNWSVGISAGCYHPMLFPMKYLADCSGWMGVVEVRKQLVPALAMGVEADIYLRMNREERRDPRTVIGPAFYLNVSRLIRGYAGAPRFFEVEAMVMPAWGHLYRGTDSKYFPDENYFATKFGLDFRFNVGRDKAWTVGLKPAMVYDLSVPHGNQYESFDINHADLQLTVGATYHIKGRKQPRHLTFAKPVADASEIDRLNEVVNYLRQDVEQCAAAAERSKAAADSLEKRGRELEAHIKDLENRKPKVTERVLETYETQVTFAAGSRSVGQTQMPGIDGVAAFLKEHPNAAVKVTAFVRESDKDAASILALQRVEAVSNAIIVKTGVAKDQIEGHVETLPGRSPDYMQHAVRIRIAER